MTRRKRRDPGGIAADEAAQYLANLIGRPVAGFTPKTSSGSEAQLNLDEELAMNHVPVAQLTILAGLHHVAASERASLLNKVSSRLFPEESFDLFLFTRMAAAASRGLALSEEEMEACV